MPYDSTTATLAAPPRAAARNGTETVDLAAGPRGQEHAGHGEGHQRQAEQPIGRADVGQEAWEQRVVRADRDVERGDDERGGHDRPVPQQAQAPMNDGWASGAPRRTRQQ